MMISPLHSLTRDPRESHTLGVLSLNFSTTALSLDGRQELKDRRLGRRVHADDDDDGDDGVMQSVRRQRSRDRTLERRHDARSVVTILTTGIAADGCRLSTRVPETVWLHGARRDRYVRGLRDEYFTLI